jgi:hypothetical protein
MLLEDGARTEAMDVMHYIWTGQWPTARSPQVKGMHLDGKSAAQDVVLEPGIGYIASIHAVDPDRDTLRYEWVVMRESEATQQGGDPEVVPETIAERVEIMGEGMITLTAPDEPGPYRLFANVYDPDGLAGHANIPFLVEPAQH